MATLTSTSTRAATTDGRFTRISRSFMSACKRLLSSTDPNQVFSGRTAVDMPLLPIVPLETDVVGACTGPNGGLRQLELNKDTPTHDKDATVAGVKNWNRPTQYADGIALTLYDHKATSQEHNGDPIADAFGIVYRPNSCILAVADGVNWGIKPRQAARCAVHGCISHLNLKFCDPKCKIRDTQDVFHQMLRSFDVAQKLIVEKGGTTTTLCLAVVCELAEQPPRWGGGTDTGAGRGGGIVDSGGGGTGRSSRWGLCTVSVGDSLCFLWRSETNEVVEVTSPMHQGVERNFRDCGGCLGADVGDHPDLSNLCCCFVPMMDSDVVFLTSDGVSDNFDAVILREAVDYKPVVVGGATTATETQGGGASTSVFHVPVDGMESSPPLPYLTPEQRQRMITMKMTALLRRHLTQLKEPGETFTATEIKEVITNYVIQASDSKRRILEKTWIDEKGMELSSSERRARDKELSRKLKSIPGKLDHATIAAYKAHRLLPARTKYFRSQSVDVRLSSIK